MRDKNKRPNRCGDDQASQIGDSVEEVDHFNIKNPPKKHNKNVMALDYVKAKALLCHPHGNCKKSYQQRLEDFCNRFSDFERDFWEQVLDDQEGCHV